jgi:hypothetical protein
LRPVHLLGSIPLANNREVFEAVANTLANHVTRVPDGETGKRVGWMRWLREVFALDPKLELSGTTVKTHAAGYTFEQFRPKPGVDPQTMSFREIGYARFAQESYAEFAKLKAAGRFAPGTRFQVCMPTPIGLLWSYVAPDYQRKLERAMIERFLAEVRDTLAAIPHHELAIQWDAPHDLLTQEGARDMVLDVSRDDLVRRWAGIVEHIPAAVDLGFHFCYGDSNAAHAVEPRDTGLMTEFANALTRGLPRPISYIHMPVPRNRNDEAFFAPLKNAQWHPSTELYLGLVHLSDGVEGASRRIRAAAATRGAFGIATECGFGRQPPESVNALLRLHAEIAALT